MKKRPSAPSSGARSPLPGLLSALPPEVLSGLITSLTAGRSGQNPPANAPFAPGQRPPSAPGPASGPRNAPDGGGERSDGFARAAVAGGAAQPGLSQPQGARLPGSAAPARGPLPQDRPRQPADLKQTRQDFPRFRACRSACGTKIKIVFLQKDRGSRKFR